ncbi:hypothetical protein B7453_13620, partial [Pseudomonas sp. IB20]|uniref:hypothetical protein n=1 Tax=Pseudomonas sp. IB20 TaxID=1702250 RepID=UPI000BD69C50
HDGDALLSAEMCVLRWHGNTLHQVLHLVLETAVIQSFQRRTITIAGTFERKTALSALGPRLNAIS